MALQPGLPPGNAAHVCAAGACWLRAAEQHSGHAAWLSFITSHSLERLQAALLL